MKEERFTYDVNDLRIGYWLDADGAGSGVAVQTWTVYDGANPYADFNGSGSLTNRYLYTPAIDELFARVGSSNNDWYLPDRLGSVRQIARTTSGVLDALVFDSYGNLVSETSPSNGDRFGFAGMEESSIGGPSSQWHRYYFSGAGVWTSEDPIRFDAGDANLRRYTGNSPTNGVDPYGLDDTMEVPLQLMLPEPDPSEYATDPPQYAWWEWLLGLDRPPKQPAPIQKFLGYGSVTLGTAVVVVGGGYYAGPALGRAIMWGAGKVKPHLPTKFRFDPTGSWKSPRYTGNPGSVAKVKGPNLGMPHYHAKYPGRPFGGFQHHRPWDPPPPGLPWYYRF